MLLKEADEFLHTKDKSDFVEMVDKLARHGQYLSDCGMWNEAASLLDKAVQISTVINGKTSYPTLFVRGQRANAYYNSGRFPEAEQDYQFIFDRASENEHAAWLKGSAALARLANCYYDTERYEQAEQCYKKAISQWKTNTATDQIALGAEFGLGLGTPVSEAALCFSRLAEILQEQGNGVIYSSTKQTPELLNSYAATLYYQALPMWRQVYGPDGQNTAICQLHLAEILAKRSGTTLLRVAKSVDSEQLRREDQDPEKLFEGAEEGLKTSLGSSSAYYAIALLRHADYCWQKCDWQNSIKLHLQACNILNSFKG